MNEPIISISGIRGIIGDSLRPDNIVRFIKAFADYSKKKRIVIGRDGRFNGDIIEKIVESTLLFSGCEVINLGMVPTPTISLAVEELNAGGGISITASHNPQMYNGLKFIGPDGIFLNASGLTEYMKHIDKNDNIYKEWNKVKQTEYYPDYYLRHIAKVLDISFLNVSKIRKRKFNVVVDCINASGSFIIPAMLTKLGCKVQKLNCDGSGVFAREPEPLSKNLRNTCTLVRQMKADLGIVVDPDTDRLVIITDEGKPFIEENTIVAAVNNVLKNKPQKNRIAAVNLSTTRAVDDIVNNYNGKLYRSAVGEVNVIEKMKKHNAVIGGEGSGGVILPEVHYGRDALVGIALLLNEFADSDLKVSEYKKSLPQYSIIKNSFRLEDKDPEMIIDFLNKVYKNENLNNEDGLRIDFEDSWINFRKSNTEPIMRMIAEAPSMKKAEALMNRFINELKSFL